MNTYMLPLLARNGNYHQLQAERFACHELSKHILHPRPKNFQNQRPLLQVHRKKDASAMPEIHSIVTGKVVRVKPREATVSILVVGNVPVRESFQGIIRLQDVRATERDKVQMYKSYRPGDIIRLVLVKSIHIKIR